MRRELMPKQDNEPRERKRVTNLRVSELSFVDKPAVPKAKIVLFKRKGGGDAMTTDNFKVELEKAGICDECVEKVAENLELQADGMRPGENPMDMLRRNLSMLVSLRRNFPRAIREQIMMLDMNIDEFMKAGHRDEEDEEDKAEKAKKQDEDARRKPDGSLCPEGTAYQSGKCVERTKKADDEAAEKAKKVGCPPGQRFDIATRECVPMDKKQAEGIQFVIGRLKGETTTTVQTVTFDKEQWTIARAKAWLKENNFKSDKLDETEDRLRYRQRDPGDFKEGSFRTITPGERRAKTKKGEGEVDDIMKSVFEDYEELETEEEAEKAKSKKVTCPEGMVFDEEAGKCVPDRTNTPRRKSADDPDEELSALAEELEFGAEEDARLGKLLGEEEQD